MVTKRKLETTEIDLWSLPIQPVPIEMESDAEKRQAAWAGFVALAAAVRVSDPLCPPPGQYGMRDEWHER